MSTLCYPTACDSEGGQATEGAYDNNVETLDNVNSITIINDAGASWYGFTCNRFWTGVRGGEIRETDVVLNKAHLQGESSTYRKWVFAHELGHVLGLAHVDSISFGEECDEANADSIMCLDDADQHWCGLCDGPQLDDIAGILFIYADADGDGCTALEEESVQSLVGGNRNDENFWDFYDVNGTRKVDGQDTSMVRAQYNYKWFTPGYDVFRDHHGGGLYGGNWGPGGQQQNPANGQWGWGKIDGADIGLVRGQFNHSCQGGP